uniref:Uncharacterized protein n=1 Tax=Romanomermis culicivorax TaxID=13658 RepID=A0A915I000_ROMCU
MFGRLPTTEMARDLVVRQQKMTNAIFLMNPNLNNDATYENIVKCALTVTTIPAEASGQIFRFQGRNKSRRSRKRSLKKYLVRPGGASIAKIPLVDGAESKMKFRLVESSPAKPLLLWQSPCPPPRITDA